MKSLLLHVYNDSGFEDRLQVALDLARRFDAHLTCLQVTPLENYVVMDPGLGYLSSAPVLAPLRAHDATTRERVQAQLAREDVRWDWVTSEGEISRMIVQGCALSDLVILGQHRRAGPDAPDDGLGALGVAEDVVMTAQCPVLIVPKGCRDFDAADPVVIGWNASAQAAHAIRQAMPLLMASRAVHIVSVGQDEGAFPQIAASEYCARHGINTQMHILDGSPNHADEAISRFAKKIHAGLIVMGAFGRSRLSEMVLGGTTRGLLGNSDVPLLLSH
jgi:nucleotide-binding universal stress UspA family protein